MAKICKKEGCNNPVFSTGYCKYHQYLRTDKKKPKSIQAKRKTPTGELNVFMEIYEENQKTWVSFLSGRPLYGPKHYLFLNQFAHLLSKGKYPKLRLCKDNIWPIHPEEHNLLDQGTKALRERYAEKYDCDWSYIYNEIEILKKKYNE